MPKAIAKFPPSAMLLLLAACGQQPTAGNGKNESAPTSSAASSQSRTAASAVGPCRMQDGRQIPANALHAVGTEPFWAADVEGRCVTYSTPENQKGKRIWTEFQGASLEDGSWTGTLNGKPFVLRTSPDDGCSDGMSDKTYSLSATLSVRGEERSGCAEPR